MNESRIELDVAGKKLAMVVPVSQREKPLSSVLRRAGVPLNTRCGERGLCDGCLVHVTGGSVANLHTGVVVDAQWSGQIRACQHHLHHHGPQTSISIPRRSLLQQRASVVTDFKTPAIERHDPLWRRIASQPAQHYFGGAWHANGSTTPPTDRPLGLAIDIGTTTVVVLLVDLSTGKILSRAADFNQQMRLGDDVLTRITLCGGDATMLDELRRAIIEQTIVPLIKTAVQLADVNERDIVCGAIAGNTTMLHLYAGADPTPMGAVPFTPVFLEHRVLHGDLLSPWNETCGIAPAMHLLPGCSAYVGADLSAGLVAGHILTSPAPALLLDIGTNGEMILNLGDRLLGCATAAGPAFEGAGLSSGTRAVDGAISHIALQRHPFNLALQQIGEGKPIGLCGSFYVDFLAQGRKVGLLDETGRYQRNAIPELSNRFVRTECAGWALTIARGAGGVDLVVSEGDIAKLLPAKAAIAAGLHTLLDRSGLRAADIRQLHIAGGFGLHIDTASAIASGLLLGFAPEQISIVGNTALAGAWMCLCSTHALDQTIAAAGKVDVIELNEDPGFEDRYIEHLRLPDPA